jgi:His/Glu/Gln/Arg/opine family amino acid ABC transporter permease subunit
MDWSLFSYGPKGWGDELIRGFELTLRLGVTSVVLGTLAGLVLAIGELSRFSAGARLLEIYNLVMRSVPELLVIFLTYYGASFALQGGLGLLGLDYFIEVNAFWAGVLALGMIHAAYASEVFRGALFAVPSGQIEAAVAFGMSRPKTFMRIKLPIAIRLSVAGLINLMMTTLKNTPLVSAIGLQDLIRAAGEAAQNTKQYFQFYMASLVIYLVIAGAALLFQTHLEGRLFAHLGRPKTA